MPDRRSAQAEAYRALYHGTAWRHLRQQALARDFFTCQRCGSLLVTGNRHHPQAAVVNHKRPHKGDTALFFDLANLESVCKACHDALIQREEARGYVIGCDLAGRPLAPDHPWNRLNPRR
ncbi:MAG: HNH endonuclease [Pararhizobium sp.]